MFLFSFRYVFSYNNNSKVDVLFSSDIRKIIFSSRQTPFPLSSEVFPKHYTIIDLFWVCVGQFFFDTIVMFRIFCFLWNILHIIIINIVAGWSKDLQFALVAKFKRCVVAESPTQWWRRWSWRFILFIIILFFLFSSSCINAHYVCTQFLLLLIL